MKNENLQIAEIILSQLGGNRFIVFTGASQFLAVKRGLAFRLPSQFAKNGINKVTIHLDPCDTYTMRTYRVTRTGEAIEIDAESNVYCDVLEDMFEHLTGLYTSP